jgi:hypothetical protein
MNKAVTLTSQIRIGRCSHCGQILQTDDPHAPGYISPERRRNRIEEGTCDRCYSLRHSENSGAPEFGSDFVKILNEAKEKDALVVYVCDLFDLESSYVDGIEEYLPKNLLVVLNKKDILPKRNEDKEVEEEALRFLEQQGIEAADAIVTSSLTDYHISEFMKKIAEMRNGKDVYVFGQSYVGKSTLVNAFLRHYKNETNRVIQSVRVQDTSLEVLEIPLDDTSSMYDTPGIYNSRSLLSKVERSEWKYIVPRDPILVRSYPVSSSQAFLLGGVAVLEVVSGKKTDFRFEVSNEVSINRVKVSNLEKTFNALALTRQVRPLDSEIHSLSDLEVKEIIVPASGNMSISIFGLGHIEFACANQKIVLHVPPKVGVRAVAHADPRL